MPQTPVSPSPVPHLPKATETDHSLLFAEISRITAPLPLPENIAETQSFSPWLAGVRLSQKMITLLPGSRSDPPVAPPRSPKPRAPKATEGNHSSVPISAEAYHKKKSDFSLKKKKKLVIFSPPQKTEAPSFPPFPSPLLPPSLSPSAFLSLSLPRHLRSTEANHSPSDRPQKLIIHPLPQITARSPTPIPPPRSNHSVGVIRRP